MNFNRRRFLKSMGSLSIAMVPNLNRGPIQQLYSKLIPADEIIPGMPYWYASTCRECPAGCGVMHKVRDGNVIKIEGNPNHPINKGGLCPRGQAALQELYHPERIRKPIHISHNGKRTELTWEEAIIQIRSKLTAGRTTFLTNHISGSQKKFIETWLRSFPGKNSLVEYEPVSRRAYEHANKIVFNRAVPSIYHLEKADYVLSFGADFMETWQSPVKYSHAFAEARQLKNSKVAKLVYLGISDSITAANADEFHLITPTSESVVMLALAKWILDKGLRTHLSAQDVNGLGKALTHFTVEVATQLSGLDRETFEHIATELLNAENSLILCGDSLASHERGTDSQVAAAVLNYVAGNYGDTISMAADTPHKPTWSVEDFERFVTAMDNGRVSTLIIHQANPLYNYPLTHKLESALRKVPLKIALATTINETVAKADYVLPLHHSIETWGIDEPEAGVFSLVQPAMEPVFDTRPVENILLAFRLSEQLPDTYEKFIKDEWSAIFRELAPSKTFEPNWSDMLLQGGMWRKNSATTVIPSLSKSLFSYLQAFKQPVIPSGKQLHVTVSHRFYDGRGANKPWLWELPHSVNHTVWDIPARIHPDTAAQFQLKEGDIISLTANNRTIEAPVLITPMVHPAVVSMEMGAGHDNYTGVAVKETGNPLLLLSPRTDFISGDQVLITRDVTIKRTEKWRKLVRVQGSYEQHDREIIREIPLSEAIKLEAEHAHRHERHHPEIYPEHKHPLYDWAMVVDLSRCNGCGACVVSCYAENNIPIVGKQQVDRGREMAWIRVERFEMDGKHSRFLPMMCQHCEHAPCETVCPVYATVHSNEGLNVQVYNRCVGTRYCSNNCPYKARRFNYWPPQWPEPSDRQLNPDIYHRPRGVMEKCTFCSHRIRKAKEDAKIEGRTVRDDEVTPACAQSCPTGAITFGNLNDPNSKVSQLVTHYRAYVVFESLNTKPSVIYLKGIKHG